MKVGQVRAPPPDPAPQVSPRLSPKPDRPASSRRSETGIRSLSSAGFHDMTDGREVCPIRVIAGLLSSDCLAHSSPFSSPSGRPGDFHLRRVRRRQLQLCPGFGTIYAERPPVHPTTDRTNLTVEDLRDLIRLQSPLSSLRQETERYQAGRAEIRSCVDKLLAGADRRFVETVGDVDYFALLNEIVSSLTKGALRPLRAS